MAPTGLAPIKGAKHPNGTKIQAHELMPAVHRASALSKRWILATHQGVVSKELLDYYLAEFAFRYNRRMSRHRGLLFYRLAEQAMATEPQPYVELLTEPARRRRKRKVKAGTGETCRRKGRQAEERPSHPAEASGRQGDQVQGLAGDEASLRSEGKTQRDPSGLTVVFQTLSTVYLSDEQRGRLRDIIEHAASEALLGWISTPTPEEHGQRRGDYPLEVALWPDIPRHIAARMNTRSEWIEWED